MQVISKYIGTFPCVRSFENTLVFLIFIICNPKLNGIRTCDHLHASPKLNLPQCYWCRSSEDACLGAGDYAGTFPIPGAMKEGLDWRMN